MKRRKLKVKKFEDGGYGGFDGTESLGNEGFGSVGLDGSTDTGPGGYSKDVGKSHTGQSGLSILSNYGARTQEMGIMNMVPGAGIRNAIMAGRDTARMREAMNMGPTYNPKDEKGGGDAPQPCNRDASGKCMPEAKKLSKGGEFSFSKNIQKSYYKDIL